MCREQIQSYQSLQKAISQFTLTTPNLKGATYDSAKAYFSNVLYPLAQGGMILSEAVEKAVSAFPEEYLSQVDSIDLKQSELEEQIREINRLLNEAREIRTQLMSTATGETSLFQLGSNLVVIGMYTDVKKKLEEKLRKLLLFDARSTLIFLEIDSLRKAVAKGIEQTKTAWNGATGTFTVPNDLSWKTTIQEKWTTYEMEKEPEIDIREEVYPNGPNGDIVIYNVYVNGVYDDKQSNELNTMIAKNQLKEGLHFVGEFVLINDIYRVINGKDWLSGEESSRLKAAEWLALTAIPVSKLAKIAKEIKAGDKGRK
ncbi:hypothetical protein RV11_GL001994 [Enterococcus phoeniculicola]|jgi:hypothetical protein|uniref:LXG domain-containing protein n=1 Tax=Enterococcus phoeniculicola ATCC BAA-412 TaxID=1158610 RepID=R3TLT7_9ENTE|nr:T7SS effector LXG polymorphic toxin [Enterococcus phoeniculicola]EOL42444.1 hypothetical protein UC3_02796 [Enterococcus phoeniculicola ATCC BAA-412]EOT79277.1 hypothetical protein I589_00785 [Enterococcus phoeniculicola ATCC BAA-412]OJG73184.1 hypothetical protein RV11_GL001994 [Enterococcus phoeniculicola]